RRGEGEREVIRLGFPDRHPHALREGPGGEAACERLRGVGMRTLPDREPIEVALRLPHVPALRAQFRSDPGAFGDDGLYNLVGVVLALQGGERGAPRDRVDAEGGRGTPELAHEAART